MGNGINEACGCHLPNATTTPRYRSAHVWRGQPHPPRGLKLAVHPISSTNVTGPRLAAKLWAWLGIQYQRDQLQNQHCHIRTVYSSVLGPRNTAPGLYHSDCASCLRNGAMLDPPGDHAGIRVAVPCRHISVGHRGGIIESRPFSRAGQEGVRTTRLFHRSKRD